MFTPRANIKGMYNCQTVAASYLIASGPVRRSPAKPVVILEPGLAGTVSECLVAQRLVARSARVFGDRQDLAGVVHKVPESWSTLLGNATHEDVVGLTADRAVSVEELETIRRAGKLNEGIAELEFKSLLESSRKLKDCLQGWQLLADHPLSVVFCDESNDSRKAYESGVEHNNGTEEVLEKLRNHLEEMFVIDEVGMREHLAPSSCARSVKADGKRKTHQGQEVDPKGVAREILWASERLHGKMQPSEVLPGYWIARHDKSYLPTSCRMHQSSPPRDLRKALACQANPGSND